jgi:hypothetical protein
MLLFVNVVIVDDADIVVVNVVIVDDADIVVVNVVIVDDADIVVVNVVIVDDADIVVVIVDSDIFVFDDDLIQVSFYSNIPLDLCILCSS